MDTVKVIEVIETTLSRRGRGEPGSPIRIITQYWTMKGELIFEKDHWRDNLTAQIPDARLDAESRR